MDCFNLQYENVAGPDDPHPAARQVVPLVVSLRDAAGAAVGGLMASTYGEWLMMQTLWLPDAARGQGYARRLLEMAEDEARRRGCRQAFAARCCDAHHGLFERCGYQVDARGLTKPLG